jgi:hypothetical protein
MLVFTVWPHVPDCSPEPGFSIPEFFVNVLGMLAPYGELIISVQLGFWLGSIGNHKKGLPITPVPFTPTGKTFAAAEIDGFPITPIPRTPATSIAVDTSVLADIGAALKALSENADTYSTSLCL